MWRHVPVSGTWQLCVVSRVVDAMWSSAESLPVWSTRGRVGRHCMLLSADGARVRERDPGPGRVGNGIDVCSVFSV